MKLNEAQTIASTWLERLKPYTERIEIAGSIRRGKPEVHDIEIVAIPRIDTSPDLFGNPGLVINLLDAVVEAFSNQDEFRLPKNGSRYKQLVLPEGINIDLFGVLPPAQWGVIYTIRTGPADFSHWIVTSRNKGGALPSWAKVKDGAVWNGKGMIPMPEEQNFFDFLGIGWVEPRERAARWAVTARQL